jgi:hypothetical protein
MKRFYDSNELQQMNELSGTPNHHAALDAGHAICSPGVRGR